MSTNDILKKSFLNSISSSDITVQDVIVVMILTAVLAVYIFFIYRVLTRKTFYNKAFNISLAAMAMITAAIILTIQSSIVVSLGMVGALSIVRFRTAIKDPMDLVFLFWAISIGIICGARLYAIAIVASLFVTAMLMLLDLIPVAKVPKLLVINADGLDTENAVMAVVKKYSSYSRVKSRNLTDKQLDLVIELRVKEEQQMLGQLSGIEQIRSVTLLEHDGEVTF